MKKFTGVDDKGFQIIASGLTGICSTFFHDLVITPYDGKNVIYIHLIFKNLYNNSNQTKNAVIRPKQMSFMC